MHSQYPERHLAELVLGQILFKGSNELSTLSKIIDIMLKKVEKRLTEQNIIVEIDDKAKELIAKSGVDDNYGARPLRRAIQNMIEDRIAEEILDGNIVAGKKAIITAKEDKIVVESK